MLEKEYRNTRTLTRAGCNAKLLQECFIQRPFESLQYVGHERAVHDAMIISNCDTRDVIVIQRTERQAAGMN